MRCLIIIDGYSAETLYAAGASDIESFHLPESGLSKREDVLKVGFYNDENEFLVGEGYSRDLKSLDATCDAKCEKLV